MFPPLGSEPGNGHCPHVPAPPVQPTTRKSAKLTTGIVVLPLPLSADGSVSISSRFRCGSVAAGHVLPKRWLSAVVTVLPRLPVFSGTQSAAPAGAAGSGQTSSSLIWYGVAQPPTIAFVKSLLPVPSQLTPVVRLPVPVRRSASSFGGDCTPKAGCRPIVTVRVCSPLVNEYGAVRGDDGSLSETTFTGPSSPSVALVKRATVPNEPVHGLPFVVLQAFPLNVPAVSSQESVTGCPLVAPDA